MLGDTWPAEVGEEEEEESLVTAFRRVAPFYIDRGHYSGQGSGEGCNIMQCSHYEVKKLTFISIRRFFIGGGELVVGEAVAGDFFSATPF